MANTVTRAEIEKEIIEKSGEVEASRNKPDWLDTSAFKTFLDSWRKLYFYYEENPDDDVIGVEVLREYLHYTRMFRIFLLDETHQRYHEKALEALESLEGDLEEIIREVVTFKQFDDE